MSNPQSADPTGAINLAENLKEFESLEIGDEGFSDVLQNVKELTAEHTDPEPEKEPAAEPESKEEPTKPESKEEPAKEDPEAEADDDDEIDLDFPDDLTGESDESEESEEDPADEAEEELPEDASEATKVNWKKANEVKQQLRKEVKELQSAKTQMETEMEELRKKVAELPELQEKAKYVEEAEKELAIARVEGTREFKEQVDAPLKAIEDQVVQIAKDNDVSTDKLFDALAEPDAGKRRKMLKEITEEMDTMDRADVLDMAKDTQVILARQAEIRAKAGEAAKELQAKKEGEEQKTVAQKKAEFEAASNRVVDELKKRIPTSILTDIPEDASDADLAALQEEQFGRVAENLSNTDFDALTPERKAFAVASSVLLKNLVERNHKASKEIKSLKNRLSRKGKSKSRVSSDSPAPDTSQGYDGDIEAAVADALGFSQSRTITDILTEGS